MSIARQIMKTGLFLITGLSLASATDWPMWRYESNHSGISPEQLSDSLYLQWTIQNSVPAASFAKQSEEDAYGSTSDGVTPITGKISQVKKYQSYDIAYQPIVVGTTMYYGSPNDDKLSAVNVTTGAEIWHFFADAPIRMAPVAKNGKVYFGADDGCLYCINGSTGALVWKFKAAPTSRKVMGNDRLVSVWPVRGAPVIPSSANTGNSPAFADWQTRLGAATSQFKLAATTDIATELLTDSTVATNSANAMLNYNASTSSKKLDIVGLRFSNEFYRLPQGAVIDSAFIQFSVKDSGLGTAACTLSVHGESVDSSASFAGTKRNISLRTMTTASVQWVVPAWSTLKACGVDQRTPDLKAVLQELVNRTGWKSASPVTLIIKANGGSGVRGATGRTSDSLQPRLCIYSGSVSRDTLSTRPNPTFTYNNTDTNNIYFAAGLYPFEGVFVYGLNAQTGNIAWLNDGSHMMYELLPHGTDEGFSGLAPQGYLCTSTDSKLLVPDGRANPGCLNRLTGSLQFLRLNSGGDYNVISQGQKFYVHGKAFDTDSGLSAAGTVPAQFNSDLIQIQAGTKVYTAGSLSDTGTSNFTVTCGSWQRSIVGKPAGLVAANGYLFVTTMDGKILCFGTTQISSPATYQPLAVATPSDGNNAAAASILTTSGYKTGSRGICIAVGLSDGRLIEELARQSDLTVIGIDPDSAKVKHIRERLDSTGLYGNKVHVIAGDVRTAGLPPYVAQLIVTEDVNSGFAQLATDANTYVAATFRSLRPYGGVACLPIAQTTISGAVTAQKLAGADVSTSGSFTLLKKPGALPGTADRGSQYADAAHSNFVKDSLVKSPMGILWFGGSADNVNDKMNTRHGHGPTEQVAGGRYYMQGPNTLRCVDAYTGRVLWEKTIQNFGQFSDYTEHEGGQNALGDNFVSTPEAIYALGDHAVNLPPKSLLVLDPATGATQNTVTLPDSLGSWGFISICDSFIVATTQPMMFDSAKLGNGFVYWYSGTTSMVGVGGLNTYNGAVSNRIVVLNRFTGTKLWDCKSEAGFSNNGVVAGNGKVFAIDRLPAATIGLMDQLGDLGKSTTLKKVKAFNLRTGQLVWADSSNAVFGLYLAYSTSHDMLLEVSRLSRDYLYKEPAANHLVARKGSDGSLAWQWTDTTKSYYGGPVILADTLVITQDGNNFGMINLLTGNFQPVNYGITDKPLPFSFKRHYGCNYGLGATNLIAFRSGSGGYYDLTKMDGVGNWSGFKTGCTPSLVPADGIITSAEYTRTCSCNYSLQTSCALVYDPDVEKWTCNDGLTATIAKNGMKYSSIGVNLGASGDRKDDNGVFWCEYPPSEPKAGFAAYPLPMNVTVTGANVSYFRHHSSRVSGSGLKWVAASGAEGMTSVSLAMYKDSVDGTGAVVPHSTVTDQYTVTLYFMEHDPAITTGHRVFDVSVNGQSVATNLDVVSEAGGAFKVITKTATNVSVGDNITVAFVAKTGNPIFSGFSGVKTNGTAVLTSKRVETMDNQNLRTIGSAASVSSSSIAAIHNGVATGINEGLKQKKVR